MTIKRRLSASVDAHLLDAVEAAVRHGRAGSVSAWVNEAIVRHLEDDRLLQAADDYIAAYEAEHGEITEEEMQAAELADRAAAIVVRGRAGRGRRAPSPDSRESA